jgi:hypothetical protein
MRGPLFVKTNEARAEADSFQAQQLAPLSYKQAAEYYDRAEAHFSRGATIDSIRSALTKSRKLFKQSAAAGEVAVVALDTTIQARLDAQSSDAIRFDERNWAAGELAFGNAIQRLERGKIKNAQTYAAKAETAYRAAELNSSRYDTDRPRSLALEAKHKARHAIYIARLEQGIRNKETNLENILLGWEASVSRLGAALNKPLYFDAGEKAAIDEVVSSIVAL